MTVWGVVGWKNAGKTTMMERLVTEIAGRGLRVSTIKHAHHAFDVDHQGKDSFRHRAAGAGQVLVASRQRWALMTELRAAPEPPLSALLAQLAPCDLTLVEGYKRDAHPKIEVWRRATAAAPIFPDDPTVRAVACDAPPPGLDRPALPIDDPAAVADFILDALGLR